MARNHITMTSEQVVTLAREVLKRLGNGGTKPLESSKLHSWSALNFNSDPDSGTVTVSSPLMEDPSIRFDITASGAIIRYQKVNG